MGLENANRYGLERCNQTIGTKIEGKVNDKGRSPDLNQRQQAGRHPVFTCVWSNEWDKYAASIYRYHWGECDTRDIRTVDASELPDFDLLCSGFPCQAFSIAGKRRGFNDTRGTLFFEIARILQAKRPRLCLLENVKGLLSHDSGRTFKTIIATLTDLGYDCQWQVLNSKNHGVPQNRERIFIVGHLAGTPRPQVFPFGQNGGKDSSIYERKNQTASTINATYSRNQSDAQYVMQELTKNVSDAQRVYDSNGIAKTLKGLGGGMGAKTGLYDVSDTLTSIGQPPLPDGKKLSDIRMGNYSHSWDFPEEFGAVTNEEKEFLIQLLKVRRKKGYGSVPDRDGSPVWISKLENSYLIDGLVKKGYLVRTNDTVEFERSRNSIDDLRHTRIRRLTPVECERLQGFPDGWSEFGTVDGKEVVISDTQRYKCLGNAVTTTVITAIGERL